MGNLRAKRTERLQLILDAQELQLLDDLRFEYRMPSRAAAIRQLIRQGLQMEVVVNDAITPPEKFPSGEIGTIDNPLRMVSEGSCNRLSD